MIYYVLGVVYVVTVLVIAAKKPRIGMVLCFSFASIQQALPDLPVRLSISDLNLMLTFFVFVIQQLGSGKAIRWGPLALPAGFYLVVCAVSSITDWRGDSTLVSLLQMLPYLVVSIVLFSSYGRTLDDVKPAFHWLVAVGVFFAASIVIAGNTQVFGLSKNGIGSALAATVVVNAELWMSAPTVKKKRLYLASLAILVAGLLVTLSRGSWLGAACGLAVILILRREFKVFARIAAILIPMIAISWWALPAEKREFATGFESGRANIHARLEFIDTTWSIVRENPVFGIGVGLRKETDATNVILMTLAETGIVGLIAFLSIHLVLLKMAWRARKTLQPSSWAFSCLAIGTALLVTKLVHGCVDHYWSRGALLMAWAGAGIATRAFYESQMVIAPGALRRQLPPVGRHRWPAPIGSGGTVP